LDSVRSALCYILYVCFIYFSDVFDFLASIVKCSPFLVGIFICDFLVGFFCVLERFMVGMGWNYYI